MLIGRRIYYEKSTGNRIVDTGEREGLVVETTIEQDIEIYSPLSERNRESFDVLQLSYGAYAQDFAIATSYRVNPETKELEFGYPDPNEPEAPLEFRKPLSEEIEELKQENVLLKAQNQANANRADFHEEVLAEIILAINP